MILCTVFMRFALVFGVHVYILYSLWLTEEGHKMKQIALYEGAMALIGLGGHAVIL